MRSDTEHIHDWDRSVKTPGETSNDVALWRTRQMEALARFAYAHILRNSKLHKHFENDDTLREFWGASLDDATRFAIWGERNDISTIKIMRAYDQWGRGMPEPD